MNIYGLSNMTSLFSNTSQNNNNMNLYSALSDYSVIKSGAYRKLVKATIEETGNKTLKNKFKKLNSDSTSAEAKQYTQIKSAADTLSKSATALVTKGTKSLFLAKESKKTDESTGAETTVKEYDRKAIQDAISSFVKEYNNTLDIASESENTTILKNTLSLTKQTKAYSKSLEKIGININEDNTLSIDEEKLNSADITSVKSLFNDSQSFAAKTLVKSNQIGQNAVKAATNTSIYSKKGTYSSFNYYSANNWFL